MVLAGIVLIAFSSTALAGFPDGPNQQCRDDAGPPWEDDGPIAYYVGFPNTPILRNGKCPPAVEAACQQKGALAAHLDGPIDCGGRGWFCRINDQAGHRAPGFSGGRFPDSNYASCNQADTDHDLDGHCHGSDEESAYGWWIRDHWHRNYAGSLKCCCGWEEALTGVVNRCDYRKYVSPSVRPGCRDANEEHDVDMHPGCTQDDFLNYAEPPAEQCWEVMSFGPGPYEDGAAPPGAAMCQGLKKKKCKKEKDCVYDKSTSTCVPILAPPPPEHSPKERMCQRAYEMVEMCEER